MSLFSNLISYLKILKSSYFVTRVKKTSTNNFNRTLKTKERNLSLCKNITATRRALKMKIFRNKSFENSSYSFLLSRRKFEISRTFSRACFEDRGATFHRTNFRRGLSREHCFLRRLGRPRVARLSPPCAARDVATERDVHAVS